MQQISNQVRFLAGATYGVMNTKANLLLMNDPREVFHIALLLDGKSPNSENETEIKAAYERLQKIVPNVLVFNSDSPEMPYLQGEVSVGMQWSGSAHRAKSENPDLKFIFPKERCGTLVWITMSFQKVRKIKKQHINLLISYYALKVQKK